MEVLDMTALDALRSLQDDGEDDLLAELIDLFLEDAPTRISSMREAIAREDWSDLGAWAHSLKGSCGSLGATHMADLCGKLEAMGRHGGVRADAERIQRDLESQYELVREALARERDTTH
jgi:HPt (histidine-containing phosphotransfer) domain-containing protein